MIYTQPTRIDIETPSESSNSNIVTWNCFEIFRVVPVRIATNISCLGSGLVSGLSFRAQFQASVCGICGRRRGYGRGFFPPSLILIFSLSISLHRRSIRDAVTATPLRPKHWGRYYINRGFARGYTIKQCLFYTLVRDLPLLLKHCLTPGALSKTEIAVRWGWPPTSITSL